MGRRKLSGGKEQCGEWVGKGKECAGKGKECAGKGEECAGKGEECGDGDGEECVDGDGENRDECGEMGWGGWGGGDGELQGEPLVGFEPTTPRLQITCSGQLS